jgi:hypothetical protein
MDREQQGRWGTRNNVNANRYSNNTILTTEEDGDEHHTHQHIKKGP